MKKLAGIFTSMIPIVCCLVASFPAVVLADDSPPPIAPSDGRITLGGHAGDDPRVYSAGAMIPFRLPGDTLLFLNPGGFVWDDDDREMNLGLVLRRQPADRRVLLGINTFFDTRWTRAGHTFEQIGGGLEVLSPRLDFRANLYHPLTDAKRAASFEEEVVSADARSVTRTRYAEYEEALEGYDVEIGVWLPWFEQRLPTALVAGYEDFESEHRSQRLQGFTLRAESRPHPNLTLDVAWHEEDQLHRSHWFAGARLHLPLNLRRGMRLDRRNPTPRIVPFEYRILEPVRRTFRIKTFRGTTVVDEQVESIVPVWPPAPEDDSPVRPPAPECYSYATLDGDGNVIIVTVCE